jgi:hypothetical protein
MFARLGAKAVMMAVAIALVFFGIGLIGFAVATLLMTHFGAAGGYAIAGAIFLLPPLLWATIVCIARPRRQAPPGSRDLMSSIFAALARETPWAAVVGAGLVGVANLFLNRNKAKK